VPSVAIPNRAVFRSQEVCDLAEVQPYVLRSWEAEFPDLGVSKTPQGPRVYRRADVERVLHIKHLLFVDGLTLAGARKRMAGEGLAAPDQDVTDADVAAMMDADTRQGLQDVRRGLQWILGVLNGDGVTPEDRIMAAPESRGSRASKPAKKTAKKRR
jgi:DNA-binding transcriptional MerR regulator